MVDTVVLGLARFEISHGHDLTIQPPSIKPVSGYLGRNREGVSSNFDVAGLTAAKAWHNGERLNVTIKTTAAEGGGRTVAAYVQTSLPRYKSSDNLNLIPVTQAQTDGIFQAMECELEGIGIKTKINDANLIRLDLFRNVETNHPLDSYSPVLSVLDAKRMRSPIEYGGDGFLFKNTQHEICIYDKRAELEHKLSAGSRGDGLTKSQREDSARATVAALVREKNLLRFEYRMRHGDKVRDILGISTAADLVSHYDDLGHEYSDAMRKNLFHLSAQSTEILHAKQLEQLLYELKKLHPRSYVSRFQNLAGAKGMNQFGSVRQITEAILKVSGNKGTASKFKTRITEQQLFLSELRRKKIDIDATPIAELYAELREKVLRFAA